MDKRYQVFVSSTYADLKNERSRVIQTLMEMDCIPAGMELFPAADEEQWAFIRKIIDDCDYYLLIVGNRYGSVTQEGISYTEKEYDYAIDKGIRVLAFLHESPDDLPVTKSDIDPGLRTKLDRFRTKVGQNRLVKFWKSADELPGLVALSLSKTIKTYPAVGWVRATEDSNAELLGELNEVRKQNETLQGEVGTLRAKTSSESSLPNLAPLDAPLTVFGEFQGVRGTEAWKFETTWTDIFSSLSPFILEQPNDTAVKLRLTKILFDRLAKPGLSATINDRLFDTIKIQLVAHGLVSVNYLGTTKGGAALFWGLTDKGHAALLSTRAVRAQ